MREMEQDRTVKWKVYWSCNKLFTEALFSSLTVPAFQTSFDHQLRVRQTQQNKCNAGPGEL